MERTTISKLLRTSLSPEDEKETDFRHTHISLLLLMCWLYIQCTIRWNLQTHVGETLIPRHLWHHLDIILPVGVVWSDATRFCQTQMCGTPNHWVCGCVFTSLQNYIYIYTHYIYICISSTTLHALYGLCLKIPSGMITKKKLCMLFVCQLTVHISFSYIS